MQAFFFDLFGKKQYNHNNKTSSEKYFFLLTLSISVQQKSMALLTWYGKELSTSSLSTKYKGIQYLPKGIQHLAKLDK